MEKFSERDLSVAAVTEELVRSGKEAKYWMFTANIEETKNIVKKILWKIKRKLL